MSPGRRILSGAVHLDGAGPDQDVAQLRPKAAGAVSRRAGGESLATGRKWSEYQFDLDDKSENVSRPLPARWSRFQVAILMSHGPFGCTMVLP